MAVNINPVNDGDLLIEAIKNNNVQQINILITPNVLTKLPRVNLNTFRDARGLSALHLAVEYNRANLIQTILHLYPTLHQLLCNGYSPLHMAAHFGHIPCIEALIGRGADVNIKDNYNKTPIMYALSNYQMHALVILALSGADCSYPIQIATCLDPVKQSINNQAAQFLTLTQKFRQSADLGEPQLKEIMGYLNDLAQSTESWARLAIIYILNIANSKQKTLLSFLNRSNASYLQSLHKQLLPWRDYQRNTFLHLMIKYGKQPAEISTFLLNVLTDKKIESVSKALSSLSLDSPKADISKLEVKKEKEEVYLFLGGGDLSFELSFAKKHPKLAHQMIVTTYEDEPIFLKHRLSVANRAELMRMGVRVYHSVDATQLHLYEIFKDKNLSRIYFCHPYAGTTIGGKDTIKVLKDFFVSAALLQEMGSKIIIARRRNNGDGVSKGHYKGTYGFYVFTTQINFQYRLVKKHKFNQTRFPGYNHVTTGKTATSPFSNNGSLEYVFEKINNHLGYNSGMEEDSDSDTEISNIESCIERRNRLGQTLLHFAIQERKLPIVVRLLNLRADANAIDSNGQSPLFYICNMEDKYTLPMARYLLAFGAEIDSKSPVSSLGTPFSYLQSIMSPNSGRNGIQLRALLKLFVESNPGIIEPYKTSNSPSNKYFFDLCTDLIKDFKKSKGIYDRNEVRIQLLEKKCYSPAIIEGNEIGIYKDSQGEFRVIYKKANGLYYSNILDLNIQHKLKDFKFDNQILDRTKYLSIYEAILHFITYHQMKKIKKASSVAAKGISQGSSLLRVQNEILHAELKSGEKLQFEEFEAKADGSCGFYVLGISRQKVVELLLPLSDDESARSILAPEVAASIINNDMGLATTKQSAELLQSFFELNKRREELVNTANDLIAKIRPKDAIRRGFEQLIEFFSSNKDTHEFVDALKVLQNHQGLEMNNKKSIEEYSRSKEAYQTYISSLAKIGWLGYNTARLVARAKTFKLFIWAKSKEPKKLVLLASENDNLTNEVTTIHMLHTNGFTHFNLLARTLEPKLDNTLNFKKNIKQDDDLNKNATVIFRINPTMKPNTIPKNNVPQTNLQIFEAIKCGNCELTEKILKEQGFKEDIVDPQSTKSMIQIAAEITDGTTRMNIMMTLTKGIEENRKKGIGARDGRQI